MAGVLLWYVYLLEEIGEMVLMESIGLYDRRMMAWWVVDLHLDIIQQWNNSRTLDTSIPIHHNDYVTLGTAFIHSVG